MEKPFKSLFIREMQAALVDFRFWIVLVLCLSIIPLSFYVSVKSYSQQLSDYQQERQAYKDNLSDPRAYANLNAEGVRKPSPLSIFSKGIDNKMPYKVITSRNEGYKIEYAKPDNKKDLLGEMDFAFIVAFVLSILAIVFTYSSISGDKENGTLRVVLANAVYRRQVITAKLFGSYIVFLIPFLLSMLVALIVVYYSGIIPVFSSELLVPTLIMIGLSLIFLFAMFCLGLWISALSRSSILSVNILLLIWIVMGLVVPKISPIIGSAIFPVESTGVFEAQKKIINTIIKKELYVEEEELYEKIRSELSSQESGISSSGVINDAYDEQVIPIREKYEQRISSEIEKLTNDYNIRKTKQNNIAGSIALLSPVNSITNLMAEFSFNGYSEADNFMQHAREYLTTVKQEVYDKFDVKTYRSKGGSSLRTMHLDGSDNIIVPVLDNYKHVDISKVMQQNWFDIVLLCFYCLLFFVCAFISFLRFDVR